jgi:hypothetical protein
MGPPMPHHDWLRETWAGEVFAIVNAVVAGGRDGYEVRAAVRDKVRAIVCGQDDDVTRH